MKKFKNKKKFILKLIEDDLTHWKMIHAFNQLGFQADEYALHASGVILDLIPIKSEGLEWEGIHDEYLDKTNKVQHIDILESPRLLHALAEEIYDFLKNKRKDEKKLKATDYK